MLRAEIGPGHYHASHNLVKNACPTFMMRKSSVGEIEKEAFRRRKEARFDGSGAPIKKVYVPLDLKPLEER